MTLVNLKAVSTLVEHGWDEETVPEAWLTLNNCGIAVSDLDWSLEEVVAEAALRRSAWGHLAAIDHEISNLPPVSALFERAA